MIPRTQTLSGVIDANVSSYTLGGTCYDSTVSGAGMYRVVIPFAVQGGGNLAC